MTWALISLGIMAAVVALGVAWVWLCSWLDWRAWAAGKVRSVDCYYVDGPLDHERARIMAQRDRDAKKKGVKVV